jgi:hypothetical protein
MQKQISNRPSQLGMTMYGMLFALLVVGFVATAAIKLGPAYMDNTVVKRALDAIHQDYSGMNMQDVTDNEIRGKVQKYFQINMVSPEIENSMVITRVKEQVILSFNYEIRTRFMGNVDTVLVFNNEVDLAD